MRFHLVARPPIEPENGRCTPHPGMGSSARIGVSTGSRPIALGVASMIAAAAYLINSLAPVVGWLRPARLVSPFFYAVGDNQLVEGVSFSAFVVLTTIAVVLSWSAIAAFGHLDVN